MATKCGRPAMLSDMERVGPRPSPSRREWRAHFGNFSTDVIVRLSLILLCSVEWAHAKYIEGVVDTPTQNWMFLTRFCFYSQKGLFIYKIEYPLTCEQKEAVLSAENHQIVNLSVEVGFSGCHPIKRHDVPYLECYGERRFETARERWWFVAISNCNSTEGLNFNYKIKMTNGNPGDLRFEHFSADEFGILEMSLAFLVLHILLLGMSVYSAVALHNRHLLHKTFKLYLLAITTYCLALMLIAIAYSRYALDGIGLPLVKLWGQVLQSSSSAVFLLLLLLLAKGYTVTRARLSFLGGLKLAIFMFLYCVTSAALFIYKEHAFDPGEVLYLYESPAGHGLIVLKLVSWVMFLCSIVFTLKHYPEKALFYFPFLAFYTLWFVTGPILILFSNYVIDKWVREKAVFGVEISITFLAFLAFWSLTIPAFANANFPYHVRTTQIGTTLMQANGTLTTTNLDAFAHHPYAPSAPPLELAPTPSPAYELFVVGQQQAQLGIQQQQTNLDNGYTIGNGVPASVYGGQQVAPPFIAANGYLSPMPPRPAYPRATRRDPTEEDEQRTNSTPGCVLPASYTAEVGPNRDH